MSRARMLMRRVHGRVRQGPGEAERAAREVLAFVGGAYRGRRTAGGARGRGAGHAGGAGRAGRGPGPRGRPVPAGRGRVHGRGAALVRRGVRGPAGRRSSHAPRATRPRPSGRCGRRWSTAGRTWSRPGGPSCTSSWPSCIGGRGLDRGGRRARPGGRALGRRGGRERDAWRLGAASAGRAAAAPGTAGRGRRGAGVGAARPVRRDARRRRASSRRVVARRLSERARRAPGGGRTPVAGRRASPGTGPSSRTTRRSPTSPPSPSADAGLTARRTAPTRARASCGSALGNPSLPRPLPARPRVAGAPAGGGGAERRAGADGARGRTMCAAALAEADDRGARPGSSPNSATPTASSVTCSPVRPRRTPRTSRSGPRWRGPWPSGQAVACSPRSARTACTAAPAPNSPRAAGGRPGPPGRAAARARAVLVGVRGRTTTGRRGGRSRRAEAGRCSRWWRSRTE